MNLQTPLANSRLDLQPLFEKASLPNSAHAGLVFNKFLDLWEMTSDISTPEKKEIRNVLNDFVKQYNERNSNNSEACRLLSEVNERIKRYGEKYNIKTLKGRVAWRFACGMGNPNPIENGFDFDPIIGVPIINGTAIKGLCRYVAKQNNHNDTEITRLFGHENIEPYITEAITGEISFFDAIPTKWPTLGVDIINCHHQSYYTKIEDNWPRETESPIPVFFLTVQSDMEFIFRISSRHQNVDDIKTVFDFLECGLNYFGIGGKTAVGYGTFNVSQ